MLFIRGNAQMQTTCNEDHGVVFHNVPAPVETIPMSEKVQLDHKKKVHDDIDRYIYM